MIVLFLLAAVVYTAAGLYSTYQTAQTEFDRAANISVDANLVNANVRDLILDIPAEDAVQEVYDNLAQADYVQELDANWERVKDGKICYSFKDLQISVSGEVLNITATLNMPLPWAARIPSSVNIPVRAESRVLYLD
jgi:Na+-transporting NADH:ubiquinone oxidoreductase subunit NqrC